MIALFLTYMITVHLKKLAFYSYHGVHEEEGIAGGNFEVNALVRYKPRQGIIRQLEETINYVSLYEIIKDRMNRPSPLLETIAMEIADVFLEQFSLIREVEISITKLQPPIASFVGTVGITYQKKRND
ncbi:dihydroneopterin aldolase [Segetibacter sp. 3557_3]|uniref:dihydroneopterin aldolase n=1 Tax=Segetibacter sp. 3557_3 TaxID=2547429 RepID=UPI001404C116|nr:dihydroneopterin aldolase [Segetibacter sp. 3557_3]